MARKALFKRVSAEERRADSQQVLARLLQILDESFDRSEAAADVLLMLNSPTDIADRYLQLFGDTLKHGWRTDKTYDWNRTRIEEAIERYSYKGTRQAQIDVITEFGGDPGPVKDMASTLLIVGRQGRLGTSNCVLVGPDFYHDGSYRHDIDIKIDTPEFYAEYEKQRPAGHVWWYRILHAIEGLEEQDGSFDVADLHRVDNLFDGVLGRTLINFLPLEFGINPGFDVEEQGVDWQYLTNAYQDVLGRTLINFLPISDNVASGFDVIESDVDVQYLTNAYDGTLGLARLNDELSLDEGYGVRGGFDAIDIVHSGVGVIGGALYANSLFYVNSSIPISDEIPAELAGVHSGFDVIETEV